MSDVADVPEAWVQKAARAGFAEWESVSWSNANANVQALYVRTARAVLAAVLPDVRDAVVDRDALAEALAEVVVPGGDDAFTHDECVSDQDDYRRMARELLASGVVQDAADVRRAVAESLSGPLTHDERRTLHDGVCPQHRDTAPGVYVCGPCESAGDATVERIIAARIARAAARDDGPQEARP